MMEMKKSVSLLMGLAILNIDASTALAQNPHPIARVGGCVNTRITSIGPRLEGDRTFESGMHFDTAAGVGGVGYDRVPALRRSRVGDRVRSCLISIPRHCPPGDDRGRMYRTTNLRTHQSWTMSDSQHSCGGA
jgi:hypothetical protein